jgi:uncharacterized protein (DUF302 family)
MSLPLKIFSRAILLCLAVFSATSSAEEMLMVRSKQGFPETMNVLQNSIIEHMYTLSRVQRIDVGLTTAGYKTDKYRVVFFGKHDELKRITEKYPQMLAYLPLKISIFSEGEHTLLVALNPRKYADIVKDREMEIILRRWENDIRSIFRDIRKAED